MGSFKCDNSPDFGVVVVVKADLVVLSAVVSSTSFFRLEVAFSSDGVEYVSTGFCVAVISPASGLIAPLPIKSLAILGGEKNWKK